MDVGALLLGGVLVFAVVCVFIVRTWTNNLAKAIEKRDEAVRNIDGYGN